uniref:Uncharacterized protein n=1 Tax=Aegilops tauschii subsp. strangulata TaxID=200361 RepID=A0A453KFZ4_AEGTS
KQCRVFQENLLQHLGIKDAPSNTSIIAMS